MLVRQLDRGVTPRKGKLTWVAVAAMLLFAALLLAAVLRPVIARHDGPEPGPPRVVEQPPR